MSARMAAATGDQSWIDRYRQFEPELGALIAEARLLTPMPNELGGARETDTANQALVRMEETSFELVRQGRKNEALALLTGPEYERQKQIYAAGMDAFIKEVEVWQQNELGRPRQTGPRRHGPPSGDLGIRSGALASHPVEDLAGVAGQGPTNEIGIADALRESEERHRVLFERFRGCNHDRVAPPSWRCTSGNPADRGDVRRHRRRAAHIARLQRIVSPEFQPDGRPSAEKATEMIETAMREGSLTVEWTHRRLNGEDFPALVQLARMTIGGQPLVQARVHDIAAGRRPRRQSDARPRSSRR